MCKFRTSILIGLTPVNISAPCFTVSLTVTHLDDCAILLKMRALSMVTGGKTNGLDNYLVINGRARVTEGGAPELLNRLAQIYIAPGATFPPSGVPEGYITRITPESIHGIGPWND